MKTKVWHCWEICNLQAGCMLVAVSSHRWECSSHCVCQAECSAAPFWAMLLWGGGAERLMVRAWPVLVQTAPGEVAWGDWACKRCFLATLKGSLLCQGLSGLVGGKKFNHFMRQRKSKLDCAKYLKSRLKSASSSKIKSTQQRRFRSYSVPTSLNNGSSFLTLWTCFL